MRVGDLVLINKPRVVSGYSWHRNEPERKYIGEITKIHYSGVGLRLLFIPKSHIAFPYDDWYYGNREFKVIKNKKQLEKILDDLMVEEL